MRTTNPNGIPRLALLALAAGIVIGGGFIIASFIAENAHPSYRLVGAFLILILASNLLAKIARAYAEYRNA